MTSPAVIMSRKYDVAEFFFGDEATSRLDIIDEMLQQDYSGHSEFAGVMEAFRRYARGDSLSYSTDLMNVTTAGFGTCDHGGNWDYELPGKFVKKYLIHYK